jgi:RNA polymerase sigma-70 factor (ECF subfamily)
MSHSAALPAQPFEDALVGAIPSLYRFALFLAGDDSRADDLMQDTFARALAHRDQFVLGTDCRAWLFKIAHNLHRRIETRARREVHEDDATLEALAAAALHAGMQGMDPMGTVFEHPDLAGALDRALDLLPEQYRTVVVLVDLEDQSYADAASVLDVPVGTVRSRLFRARRLLQGELLSYAQDTGLVRPMMGDREP